MIDLHRHATLAPDAQRLVHRLEIAVGLGTHVRDVNTTEWRHRFRHLHQLTGSGVVSRRIDQRTGNAERAVSHRIRGYDAHGVELRRRRYTRSVALGVHTHRRRADERSDIHRNAVLLHRGQPCTKAVRSAEGAERTRLHRVVVRAQLRRSQFQNCCVHRRRRTAFAENLRCHALRHLPGVATIADGETDA